MILRVNLGLASCLSLCLENIACFSVLSQQYYCPGEMNILEVVGKLHQRGEKLLGSVTVDFFIFFLLLAQGP